MPLTHHSFSQKSLRLSPMYLFYFALFATFVPYIARFLTANGLTGQQASFIVAIVNGVNVFAPFLFSFIADRTGRRLVFIRTGYAAITIFYFAAMFGSGFWFYLTVFGLFGIFLSAVLPQMEVVTLALLGDQKHRYGQVRLWGSIGFVIIAWVIGIMLDSFSVIIIPIFGSVIATLMFLSTFLIPEKVADNTPINDMAQMPLDHVRLPLSQIVILMGVVFLWQLSMAPYNTFFDLYLRAHGSTATINGFLISFGAFSEILIFLTVSKFIVGFSERSLMCFALAITTIRWLLLATFPEYFSVMLLTQAMHAITFGLVHSVVVHRIGRLFPDSRASFGQGMYVAFGQGIGLFVGNIVAGIFWDGSGVIYIQAAFWAFIALVITWFGFRDSSRKK